MYQNFLLKTALLLFSFLFTKNQLAFSQAKPTGILDTLDKITVADFELPKSNAIDSNSNAVIISDKGSVKFEGNEEDWVSYVYQRKTRIKILSKKAYELAKIIIPLHGIEDYRDKLEYLQASTYNIENGKVIETKLNDSDVYDEQIRNSLHEKRFTMPDLKEGSIIEYSFAIVSHHYYNIPDWNFQYLQYPCLYSEFKISIPDLLRFITLKYGIDSFNVVNSSNSHANLMMADVKVSTDIHNHTWIMKDIPAFKYEDYIIEPKKYLDKIEFDLAQIYNGRKITSIPTNWKTATKDLIADKYFGKAIDVDNADNLYKTMKKVCSLDGDPIDAAKQIYAYVRNNFTCDPNDAIFLQNDLYEVNKTHKGSVAELNLLLTALLRQRGIRADPVILATKSYGHLSDTFPVFEKINYVICMITSEKGRIFLDASDPGIGFGKIPLDCYNGPAEIIYEQHNDSLYLDPADIKETNITSVLLVNGDKESGENGSLETTLGYYESYNLRNSYKEKDGQEKYLKNLKKDYGPDVDISNLNIDSLNQLDNPIKINYDISYKNGFDGDVIYFNPVIKGAYKENPFKAAERKYPVELPYPINETYDLTMDIPNGFKVDELPKSVQANFNGNDGMFLYRITKDEYTVQLHMQLKINKALFAPDDYSALRDFFTMVLKKQSEQVVFKKK